LTAKTPRKKATQTIFASTILAATVASTLAPAVATGEPDNGKAKTVTAGSTITVSENETIKNNADTHVDGDTATTEAAPTLQGAVDVKNIKVALAETPEEGAKKGGATVGWGAKAQADDKQNLTGAQDATLANGTPTLAVVPLTTKSGWKPGWGVLGQDVSNHQPNINWKAQYAGGSRFSWMKTSEGTTYVDPTFSGHYRGAREAGLVTGGYHFALPPQSSGRTQAEIFIKNGGGWSADGKTLPGMLDLEYNPYPSLGNTCFGMSQSQLKTWTWDFINTYKEKTGRYPTIYSTTDWWNTCMGGTNEFKGAPLHIANYSTGPGFMPGGSTSFDIWQFSSVAPFAGDSNVFNGTAAELDNFVRNANYVSKWGSNGKVSPAPTGFRSARAPEAPKPAPVVDNGDRNFGNGGYLNINSGIGSYWNKNQERYGTPIGRELALPNGWAQDFTNGYRILHRKDGKGGAVYLRGAIGDLWVKNGNEYGKFGYPLTDEYSFRESAQQDFDSGKKLIWSEKNGVHVMTNFKPIIQKWFDLGDVRGVGTPITDEVTNGDVIHQDFRTNDGFKITRISWNTRTNTVTVTNVNEQSSNGFIIKGGIREYLNRIGTDYGGAASNERTIDALHGVWEQDFKSGHRVVYSYGAQGKSVWTRGAIGGKWVQSGGSAGTYRYPTDEEKLRDGIYYQDFASGHRLAWTERTGTHEIWMRGAIGAKWLTNPSFYGAPATNEMYRGNGVVTQDFITNNGQNNKLVWTEKTGAHNIDINSAIARKWLSYGEIGKNRLGVPVSEEYHVNGGRAQDFKNGDDYYIVGWDASTNRTHVIQFNSEVGKKWAREGHWDKHGFPQSDVVGDRNATTQTFSKTGRISTIATGTAHGSSGFRSALAAEPVAVQNHDKHSDIVKSAKSGLGGTYVWGGKTFKSWDCSGFVSWVYAQHGIKLTPYTYSMKNELKPTSTPKPGDIVFQNGYSHVGIYLGDGKMISALNPSSGTLIHPVNWMPVDGYYTAL
jgi:GH25 family lysozyme M1 (1,4-beta-N-acetylmuramidase)/cell wall-associated NlpC family hydrolase